MRTKGRRPPRAREWKGVPTLPKRLVGDEVRKEQPNATGGTPGGRREGKGTDAAPRAASTASATGATAAFTRSGEKRGQRQGARPIRVSEDVPTSSELPEVPHGTELPEVPHGTEQGREGDTRMKRNVINVQDERGTPSGSCPSLVLQRTLSLLQVFLASQVVLL